LAVFGVFTFFGSISTLFLRDAFLQQILGLSIFLFNNLKVLKVSRKSEAES